MWNLYSLTTNQEAIRRFFETQREEDGNLPLFPAVFPGNDAPAVRLAEDQAGEPAMMSWEFVLLQQGKTPKSVTTSSRQKDCSQPILKIIRRQLPPPIFLIRRA